jgi:hypothetical protein
MPSEATNILVEDLTRQTPLREFGVKGCRREEGSFLLF